MLNRHNPTMPSISLVTTCYNAAKLLPVTLRSIQQQTLLLDPQAQFEYIIVDANSTDASCELIEEAAKELPITYIREADHGMYDGLSKGLTRCSGDVVGYINAGDYLFPTALASMHDAFRDTDALWLTGFNTVANKHGHPSRITLPFRYRKRFFESGIHGTSLYILQQESTFWRRELMDDFDWDTFRSLKLAGDFFLWQHFSKKSDCKILHTLIGAFCAHDGQLSENRAGYIKEIRSLSRKSKVWEQLLAKIDRKIKLAPNGIKHRLSGKAHIRYDHATEKYTYL